ncbi:MAG: MBL fold metallo-hydrolase, partial [Gemmatimonadota bacterium]
FGDGSRPAAIILTHGHFDHIGALAELAVRWSVPVYAHPLEMPYLTGRSAYPPPDPSVGGGAMSVLSRFYPSGPFDFRGIVRTLPPDGTVPGLPEWRWIHTPGHAPGHVSLFRDRDRTLIAGDALVTTQQESAMAVLSQRREIHGPPAYFTPDWRSARRSVERLAALDPVVVATGHGRPLIGNVRESLRLLARHFNTLALPTHGRYVEHPAVMDERGTVSVPPRVSDPFARGVIAAGVALGLLIAVRSLKRQRA